MVSQPKARVLVADDDWTLLSLFSTAFSKHGFEVQTVKNGRDALTVLSNFPADVILLDMHLPDISGIETMRQIRRNSSSVVFLMTNEQLHSSHDLAVREGAADFIVKPVRLVELERRIRIALRMRDLEAERNKLLELLKHQSIRDELTGLYSQTHFEAQLNIEVQRSLRYRRPMSVIMYNIDDVSLEAETAGPHSQARVLRDVSRSLSQSVRSTDSVCRYGGEEFAVLLPETQSNQALRVADRTRQAVKAASVSSTREVSVSCGIAELRQAEHSTDLLRRAGSALCSARRSGRNRAELA